MFLVFGCEVYRDINQLFGRWILLKFGCDVLYNPLLFPSLPQSILFTLSLYFLLLKAFPIITDKNLNTCNRGFRSSVTGRRLFYLGFTFNLFWPNLKRFTDSEFNHYINRYYNLAPMCAKVLSNKSKHFIYGFSFQRGKMKKLNQQKNSILIQIDQTGNVRRSTWSMINGQISGEEIIIMSSDKGSLSLCRVYPMAIYYWLPLNSIKHAPKAMAVLHIIVNLSLWKATFWCQMQVRL